MAAALGIFYVRSRMFGELLGASRWCQHPGTAQTSQSRGCGLSVRTPWLSASSIVVLGAGCSGSWCLAAPGEGRRMRSGAAGLCSAGGDTSWPIGQMGLLLGTSYPGAGLHITSGESWRAGSDFGLVEAVYAE